MKAVECKKSGSPEVIRIIDLEIPSPKPNEILVKVKASSVTSGDVKLRKISHFILVPIGIIFGFKPMKITGIEFSGIVEKIGENVKNFSKGDFVYGTTTGLQFGANAEYVCIPEVSKKRVMIKKPENISFSEAAVVPVGGMTALHFLKKANINKDDKILIYGASGSVGSFAVQIAKQFGANVTGVCSTKNLNMVKSIGANSVIDYLKKDFKNSDEIYDIIFDTVGKISKSSCKKVLKKNGKYLSVKYPSS
jgi:NADPH:quinone reductase-like Zn-dependent oxidoreductase